MSAKGAVYIAIGKRAQDEAEKSAASLKDQMPRLSISMITKTPSNVPADFSPAQVARWLKVTAYKWTPYTKTLLLDADTRIKGSLELGFDLLKECDLVLVPSMPPKPGAVLWSLDGNDREYTFEVLGRQPHIMFNSGVMWFEKSRRVGRFFERWAREWDRFKSQDQGALLRALKSPVSLRLLGYPWNSKDGEIVDHRFGSAA